MRSAGSPCPLPFGRDAPARRTAGCDRWLGLRIQRVIRRTEGRGRGCRLPQFGAAVDCADGSAGRSGPLDPLQLRGPQSQPATTMAAQIEEVFEDWIDNQGKTGMAGLARWRHSN